LSSACPGWRAHPRIIMAEPPFCDGYGGGWLHLPLFALYQDHRTLDPRLGVYGGEGRTPECILYFFGGANGVAPTHL